MHLKFHSSVLFVKNIEKAKAFYINTLNQKIEHDFGNNISFKSGLSLWQIPDQHSLKDKFHSANSRNTALELYLETTDIESIYNLILSHNCDLYHEIIEETWGQRTFRFFDPDQNLIEIGESLPTFVNRMYSDGLSIDQIALKTGIPLQIVKDIIA